MPSAEQMQEVMKLWQNWIGGIAAQGKYSGTNRLYPEGKTIKPGNLIIDGPYAEIKEMVGGYLIVKASTLDEAVEMAKSCPNLIYGGNVEIRSVMSIEYDTNAEKFLEVK
ncbi:MAG: YciI family protein [Chitinophagaceae bacterium]